MSPAGTPGYPTPLLALYIEERLLKHSFPKLKSAYTEIDVIIDERDVQRAIDAYTLLKAGLSNVKSY